VTTRRHLLALIAALPAGAALPARASVAPKPGLKDPRIQTIDFDPDEVVALRVALGYALTVEFSSDERIENVALGNSAVWQVVANRRADHLFIKPMQGATNTNLNVVTDTREYNFDLTAIPAPDAATAISLRFVYPVSLDQPAPQASPKARFRFTGAGSIRPASMYDNGLATFVEWREDSQIPAIFMINDQGAEVLINGAMRDGKYVIDLVADHFVFRLGKQKATATRVLDKGQK
jgi:type IV secretion system protein VirB9